jgi:hypothetical protein
LTLGSSQRKAQMDSSVKHWNDRRREMQAGNAISKNEYLCAAHFLKDEARALELKNQTRHWLRQA